MQKTWLMEHFFYAAMNRTLATYLGKIGNLTNIN
jgi:hypothetical protein